MTEEDKVELRLEISSKLLAELKQQLETEYGTITQDTINKEVEIAINGYLKAKRLKLIGTG
jgi:hypothetical protein